jgi:hypothetical protein
VFDPGHTAHDRRGPDPDWLLVARRGREKLHYLNAAPISDIAERWISSYDQPRVEALADLRNALEETEVEAPSFVYTTYIRATPERLWQGLTDPAFTRRYWQTDRSWVRAPPAPPAVIRYIRCCPWTDAGGIACRQIGLPGQHLPSQISRQRGPARTRLRFQLTPRPRCGDPQAKTHPRPIGTAPAGQQAFPIRPSKGPEPLKGKRPTAAPFQEVTVTRERSSEPQDRRVPDRSDPLHGRRRTARLKGSDHGCECGPG